MLMGCGQTVPWYVAPLLVLVCPAAIVSMCEVCLLVQLAPIHVANISKSLAIRIRVRGSYILAFVFIKATM